MSKLHFLAHQPPSLWRNNPVLVQMLGLSPLLAITDSAAQSLGLGLVTAAVLLVTSSLVSVCRRLISESWRFVIYLVLLAISTTFADLLLQWQFYPLHKALGLYLPLISCNLALVLHLDAQTRKQALIPALGSAALTACAYLSVLVGFAILREWLGTGTLSLDLMQLRSAASPPVSPPVSLPVSQPASQPDMVVPTTTPWSMPFMLLPPAACLLLGLLLAVRNWLQPAATDRVTHKGEIIPVARVRVTGRIQGS